MYRHVFLFFILLLAMILFVFFAGIPVRETHVAPTDKTAGIRREAHIAESEQKIQFEEIKKDPSHVSDTISKLSETVVELQKKIADVSVPKISPIPTLSPEEINDRARAALVNIYCTTESGGSSRLYTGSGVIIDSRGIVLTNAHVAERFLIENAPTFGATDCIIRGGSPASPLYDGELLYISPSWIKENAAALREENPRGTGEHDFALLRITRSLRKDVPLPAQFSYLTPEFDRDNIEVGTSVLLASYPAGFLGSIAVQKDLYQTSTIAQIKKLFTFENGSVDLFSVGGNIISQKGSSGSGVVSLNTGRILGIVVTSNYGATTAERDLHAIVFAHMSESMKQDTDSTLEQFLSGDPATEAASFVNTISPALLQILSQ